MKEYTNIKADDFCCVGAVLIKYYPPYFPSHEKGPW